MENKVSFSPYWQQIRFPLLLAGAGFFILGLPVVWFGNQEVFLWINRQLTPRFGAIARIFTELGTHWPMVWLVAFCLRKPLRMLLAVLLTWLFGACLSWLFKLWLMSGAVRPFRFFQEKGLALNVVEGIDVHHYNTFPSGHTLTAFSAWFIFLFVRNLPVSVWWQVGLWLLAFGCGLSRVVLVQHWPTDVLGGMCLGMTAAFLAGWVSTQIPENKWLNQSLTSAFGLGLSLGKK